jgi:hypothetical protein
MRTIDEIDCAQCKLTCGLATTFAPGPLIPSTVKKAAQFAGSQAASYGVCEVVCKDKCNKDKCDD